MESRCTGVLLAADHVPVVDVNVVRVNVVRVEFIQRGFRFLVVGWWLRPIRIVLRSWSVLAWHGHDRRLRLISGDVDPLIILKLAICTIGCRLGLAKAGCPYASLTGRL